jgi:hypothetical protein
MQPNLAHTHASQLLISGDWATRSKQIPLAQNFGNIILYDAYIKGPLAMHFLSNFFLDIYASLYLSLSLFELVISLPTGGFVMEN